MPFNKAFNNDLIKIIELIRVKKIDGDDGALKLFEKHLSLIVNIGSFSIENWDYTWRGLIYELGVLFRNNNSEKFLNIMDDYRNKLNKDQLEVLEFYYSEILIYCEDSSLIVNYYIELIKKYPFNPEFKHTYSHFLLNNKDFSKAIEYYKFAYKIDPNYNQFLNSLFICYYTYLNTFIENENFYEGLEFCKDIVNSNIFKREFVYQNTMIDYSSRFEDHILIQKKINTTLEKSKEIMIEESKKSQNRLIEVLGFFTAIIAFIFSTVSIGKNFAFNEAIKFNISLGISLMLFVLLINLLFGKEVKKFYDFRILILIFLIISLLIIIFCFQ